MTDADIEATKAPLMEHLIELRARLIKAVIAFLIGFVVCFYFSHHIYNVLIGPFVSVVGADKAKLIATHFLEQFFTNLKLSMFGAAFIAFPIIAGQIYAFVAPGLYRREKRFALPLLVSSILLFYAGVVFAYYVVFPVMFQFFADTTPQGVRMMTDINSYMDFVLTMFLCFGLAFEVPVVVVLLVLTGLVRVENLAESRGYVLIGIFIVAALLTPPDAISQTIMAIPMYLLYEGGLVMARLMNRLRRDDAAAAA